MSERIDERPRVKFDVIDDGPRSSVNLDLELELLEAMHVLEREGCCPVLDDGLIAGNGALRVGRSLLVTPSGRRPGGHDDTLVDVRSFDVGCWRAVAQGGRPTSDTPLHHAVLLEPGAGQPNPCVSLHGHILHTERAAAALTIPISIEETCFSTPADRDAMVRLLRAAPYPQHRVWIRRGHGFVVAGATVAEALQESLALVARAKKCGVFESGVG